MQRHLIVLAGAPIEVAQLEIEIALVLSPDDWRRLFLRDAFFAVASGTDLRLVLDTVCGERRRSQQA